MTAKTRTAVTIADVARECGVGTMTVSRVINNKKHVSPAMIKRVRSAIDKLNYQPNEAARILKGQSSRTIGLIVPNLADQFFSLCAHSVQQLAAQHGYMTLLFACEGNKNAEAEELSLMRSRNIAGILIVPSSETSITHLKELRSIGMPVVMIDRTFPGIDAGEVMVENFEGSLRAVNHLIDHGHKRILCVGYDSEYNSISQRIEGYKRAMHAAGLKPQYAVVHRNTPIAPRVLKHLQSPRPPTALFTMNNVTTAEIFRTLQREAIPVPRQVAIIGFDDFELASLLAVPLTAVRQPAAALGKSATLMLLEHLRSPKSDNKITSKIVLPTELVIRQSCGCKPLSKIDR